MRIIALSSIEVRKRQRKSIATGPLNELKESILGRGLLHAPVVWFDGEKAILTVGERRYSAIQIIAKENKTFIHNNQIIPPGSIPVTELADFLDDAGKLEAEIDENIHRVDFEWEERVEALASLHSMRLDHNPRQTASDTAAEIISRQTGEPAPRDSSGRVEGKTNTLSREITQAVALAPHLANDKIRSARNAHEAMALVYKSEEERLLAVITKRALSTSHTTPALEIRHADAVAELPRVQAGTFDLIIADPPYGIDASASGFRSRTIHHHNYDDTVEAARALALCVLTEGFRVTKSRANIFMFGDVDQFDWWKRVAAAMGWSPFRTPIIWKKSESEGLAPWGGSGPRRTYEMIFYATKGQRGLLTSPTDIWEIKRVPRNERIHAAEKPVELVRRLVDCSTLPNDVVLDPCCGSGSTLVACKELSRRALGIERDIDFYNTAMANVHGDAVKAG